MKCNKIVSSGFLFLAAFCLQTSASATPLSGLMTIDAGITIQVPLIDPATGQPVLDPATGNAILVPERSGSFFIMGGNTFVGLKPGTAGGILLGQYQNFVLDPDEPHPQGWQGDINGDGIADGAAGTGYDRASITGGDSIVMPFNFFGNPTSVGTNPLSYQSGNTHPVPTADVDMASCVANICTLTADFSAWEVFWNGSAFEQGPRPVNTGPFGLAEGTFNLLTNEYVLDWDSQINGGPFNGVGAAWHLEGNVVVPVPAAAWLFGTGLMALFGFARARKA